MKSVKVTTVGNSAGIVLTAEMLAKLGVKKGDELNIVESPYGLTLTAYDAKFEAQMNALQDVAHEYRDVLRELSKR